METFIMTVHTDDGNKIEFEIDAQTPDDALDLLWEKKNHDWIRIDTNMSLTEFVNANRIVKVTTQPKPVIVSGVRNAAFERG